MNTKAPPDYVIAAGNIAAEIAGKPKHGPAHDMPTKQVSVSLRLDQLASVEVFADRSNCSRGAMIATLVRLGLELVSAQLDPEVIAEVHEQVQDRFSDLAGDFDPMEG